MSITSHVLSILFIDYVVTVTLNKESYSNQTSYLRSHKQQRCLVEAGRRMGRSSTNTQAYTFKRHAQQQSLLMSSTSEEALLAAWQRHPQFKSMFQVLGTTHTINFKPP